MTLSVQQDKNFILENDGTEADRFYLLLFKLYLSAGVKNVKLIYQIKGRKQK